MPDDRNRNDRNRNNDRSRTGNAQNAPQYTLQSREYTGRDGKQHHHTNVWMSRHDKGAEKVKDNG